MIRKITGIVVQPGASGAAGAPILHAEVVASVISTLPSSVEALNGGTQKSASIERFNACGVITGRAWAVRK